MRDRLPSYLFSRFGTWVKNKLPKSMESEEGIKAASEYHSQNELKLHLKETKMSDAKRKPSGSEFKKRRLNKQTQLQKQSDALQNFLKEGSFNAPTTDQHLNNAQHLDTDFPDMDPPLDATVSITELGFSSLEKIDDNERIKWKKRPNYFVAVQISNHVVHDTLQKIQNHISSQDARLNKIMNSLPTLHITLMVMYIGDEVTHMRAMKALTNVHKEINDIMCNEPLKLEFNGLGHFRNKVLFAKIKENESYERLQNLKELVEAHFAEEEIVSTDSRTSFTPHLTVAKIDFSCRKQRAIKKIDPLLYEEFTDHYIGSETIQSIQLLSMTKPKDDVGYYTGDKLFFSLSEAC